MCIWSILIWSVNLHFTTVNYCCCLPPSSVVYKELFFWFNSLSHKVFPMPSRQHMSILCFQRATLQKFHFLKKWFYRFTCCFVKAIGIMTFAEFKEHTNPIFIDLKILKFHDIVWLQTAIFMHDFHHSDLPVVFNQFFLFVNKRHGYNTRSASRLNCSLPHVRTSYRKFSIKFVGAKVWNSLDEDLKISTKLFLKSNYLNPLLTHISLWTLLNFIESFKSEPRHRSDFHEGTPKYDNNNNVIINILDQIYASFKKLW